MAPAGVQVCVLRIVDDRLLWYAPGEGAVVVDESSTGRLRAMLAAPRTRGVLAVPGEYVRTLPLTVRPEEKKHLARSLPFLLEEEVAEDIEALHFAPVAMGELAYTVMVCRRACMAAWRERMDGLPELRSWLPEGLLLPWRPGDWTVVLEPGRALLRWGPCAASTVAEPLLPVFLNALLRENEAPERLVVFGETPPAPELLPDSLAAAVDFRRGAFPEALRFVEPEGLPTLRQGSFAPRLPLGRWWSQWRAVAVISAIAVLLQFAAGAGEYWRFSGESLALRQAVQARYRDAFPQGAVVDAERQLRRQLDLLRGGTVAGGFTRLMAAVGRAMAAESGTRLSSVNYSERSGDLRLGLTAPDFSSVERLRAGLEAEGVRAELENSTASGDGVRASLRLGSD